MKKWGIVILTIAVLVLTGCGNGYEEEKIETTETDGTVVIERETGIEKNVKSIPYDSMNYNDSTFGIKSVDLCQMEYKNGYMPYVIVEFDISTLSEEDIYWLYENDQKDFDICVYIDSEKNRIDFENMDTLYLGKDDSKVICIFTLYDYYKFDMSDMEVTVCVNVKQNDKCTYQNKNTGEISDLRKENSYDWSINRYSSDIKIDVLNGIPVEYISYIENYIGTL